MDEKKFLEARAKLDYLDDRWTHLVRPQAGGSMIRPNSDEVERRIRDLAEYTIELKEVLTTILEGLGFEAPADDQIYASPTTRPPAKP